MFITNLPLLGSRDEIKKLDEMFVSGSYTPFSGGSPSRKHPLTDATNEDNPPKKRKTQKAPSKSLYMLHVHVQCMYYRIEYIKYVTFLTYRKAKTETESWRERE